MKTSTFFHASRDALTIKTSVNAIGNVEVNLDALEADLNCYLSPAQALELMQSLSATLLDADVVEAGVETADDALADYQRLRAEALEAGVTVDELPFVTLGDPSTFPPHAVAPAVAAQLTLETDRADANAALAQKLGDDRRALRCDCGGPESGTDHAPDCSYVVGLDELGAAYDDELSDLNAEFDEKLEQLADRDDDDRQNDDGDPGRRGLMTELP